MTSDCGIQYDPIQNSIRQIIGFKGRAEKLNVYCQKAACYKADCNLA